MPAPNEFVWYKWWPAKALTSLRWLTLTLEQEGFYRRLYDLASLSQPSARRGWFYEHGRPSALAEVLQGLRIQHTKGQALVKQLASKGLMDQDENGAWGFPDFAKHQRNTPLRVRGDGLGSAERGAESAQNRRRIGATDVDVDADVDKDPPRTPCPVSRADNLSSLITDLNGVAAVYEKQPVKQQEAFMQLLAGQPDAVVGPALVELNRELEGKGKEPGNLAAYFLPIVERQTKAHAKAEAEARQTAAENAARDKTAANALPVDQAAERVQGMRENLLGRARLSAEEAAEHAEKVKAQAAQLKTEGGVQ